MGYRQGYELVVVGVPPRMCVVLCGGCGGFMGVGVGVLEIRDPPYSPLIAA